MDDRDRLAALLHEQICEYHWPDLMTCGIDHEIDAKHLMAAGVTLSERPPVDSPLKGYIGDDRKPQYPDEDETEPCPTCGHPIPLPLRGDHDYGLPLRPRPPVDPDMDYALRDRMLDVAAGRPPVDPEGATWTHQHGDGSMRRYTHLWSEETCEYGDRPTLSDGRPVVPVDPEGLREAAQAVLTELDIIRRRPEDERPLRVHPLTHDALRAALAASPVPQPVPTMADVERVRVGLRDDIAAMLHYRGRVLHPRSHSKASGGPCDECIESARQAMEFLR